MSSTNKSSGFFDKNTLLAIGLSFAVFFVWQKYVAYKYPNANKKPAITQQSPETQAKTQDATTNTAPAANQKGAASTPEAGASLVSGSEFQEQTLAFNSENVSFDISNDGMGFKNLVLKKFTDRNNGPMTYSQETFLPLAATSINGAREFKINKVSDHEYVGELKVNGLVAVKKIIVNPSNYTVRTTLEVSSQEKQKVTVDAFIQNPLHEVSSSFLLPSYEHQEFFALNAEDKYRQKLDPSKAHTAQYPNARIASLSSQYFALAIMNRSELLPKVLEKAEGKSAGLQLTFETPQPVEQQTFVYDFYYGPKKMEELKSVDEELTQLIDYGFFAFIGKPLHWTMKLLYSVVSNWGIAIILLTMLIRTLLLPMNYYSFKSMRKMQKIQPKLQAIKEKFKNDPTRINQETLQLMRAEKANPLSGCIPALLQLPIFFALYPMIGNSFELYKQPFFFWIHDLTLKDPYYVLPLLGGLVFFVQQKLTPPTPNMDPAQQKMLMIMPVFLSLFMISAPSGLALYVFINSLYGFAQQMIFMKERTT